MTKRMTTARLDALCGGPPTKVAACGVCGKRKGPYYSASLARDAVREHACWQHGGGRMVGIATDDVRRRAS